MCGATGMKSDMGKYVIVTPAYNEAAYIGRTIESVLAQTVRPIRWVIVDDGSTDETARIVKAYILDHPWIRYVFRPKVPGQSYYSSNVYAIQEGMTYLAEVGYEYLGILDADISPPTDYYEQILVRMDADEKLGIASGVYKDRIGENRFRKVLNDRRSTPKALMVFRRSCYEAIGGFVPMRYGGEDTCACFMARMKGWKAWSFPDLMAIHNKPIGTGHAKNLLKIRFRHGVGEYFMGSHPLFVLVKSLRRCAKEPPYVAGGLARWVGFIYAHFLRQPRQIPRELVRYIRKEQLSRVYRGNKVPSRFTMERPS
ncbi:MAG: glycosyltransferase family 2 protein [Sedimentisphaerales bacterium]|nr:glycosyltransferase family 2 protein [Sedimentisphaerales bacterium]